MDASDLSLILGSVLGTGVGVEIVRQTFRRVFPRDALTVEQSLRMRLAVDQTLDRLRNSVEACSVLILHGANGKRLAEPSRGFAITITNEITEDGFRHIQRDYVESPVDVGYCQLLLALINSPARYIVRTVDRATANKLTAIYGKARSDELAQVVESEMLRDIYAECGVAQGMLVRLPAPEPYIRFISIRWKEATPITAHIRNAARAAAAEIDQLTRGKWTRDR